MSEAIPSGTPWPEGWPLPNYVDPETRGNAAFFVVTASITAVIVLLRLYSRFYVTKSPGIDDAFIVAAFVGDLPFRRDPQLTVL